MGREDEVMHTEGEIACARVLDLLAGWYMFLASCTLDGCDVEAAEVLAVYREALQMTDITIAGAAKFMDTKVLPLVLARTSHVITKAARRDLS